MLQIDNLQLYTRDRRVLSIPMLYVDTGCFIAIVGANSTGKTLLFKTLCGQHKHYSGFINLKKQPIAHLYNTNNIILIDSNLPVIEHLSFLDNIQIPFEKLTTTQKNRLLEMVNILGCIDLLNQKMGECSRSQRVFMYLLRSAMISPSLLLIDDIDTFFDKEALVNVQKLILYCTKSGIIVLATAKDAVLQNSNHTYGIKAGELVKI